MKRCSDINIGIRAFEFFSFQPEGITKACKKANIPHETVCDWQNGICPSAYYLQKLCFLGADINYILTGKRSNNNDRADV